MTEPQLIRVLIIDDDEDDYLMLREMLSDIQTPTRRLTWEWASSYDLGIQAILRRSHDVCFLDYRLGARTGLDLLKEAVAAAPAMPIIFLTGYGEHEVDLEAMRIGAADYLVKDSISPSVIERSIRYSIHQFQALESFQRLLDSTFEGILVHDSEGVILEANLAAGHIFGVPGVRMRGTSLSGYFTPESDPVVRELTTSAHEVSLEASGVRRDGTRVDLEVRGKPYWHEGREVRLSAIRDLTARRQMEAQILMQDRLASVGLLASSLAHEIGTPLGVIRGRAEYLGLQTQGNPRIKKNVDVIISQIDRVSHLIQSLLNLARGDRIRKGRMIHLNDAVTEVLDLMAHELRKHSIQVRNEIHGDLPVAVAAEASPLHQVLLNLLVNSVHAIETAVRQGRPGGHFIRISAQDSGARILSLLIEDSGCGISRQNLKNLFKPFFTTKEIGVGTGLGLATSYRIIENWGGTIQVRSEEGVGTVFQINLPKWHPGGSGGSGAS